MDRVMDMAGRIPEGTIACVIRQDDPGFLDLVFHLGLVVKDGDRVLLRHAARKGYAAVIDEPLQRFIERNGKRRKWPLVGINFQEALDARGHLTEVAGGHSTDARGP
jgi:hypothetical protein